MSAGQGIGAVVGGIVGFMVAGPAGAFAGASLGMAAGGLLDPAKGPNVKGPRLDDLSIQVSTYGTDIPRIYGTIGGAGNVIQLENNKLKEKVRKKKSGGKGGGGSSETTTYSYSATFQLALCEGPIAGVRRIWCSDKLIYNAGSDDLETIIASNKAAKKWKLYLGTDDQMPDPRYEAEYGVGNVSAHRGLAYIAFYDFQLADYSNTLQGAQFKVEVVGAATYSLTSTTNKLPLLSSWSAITTNGSRFVALATGSQYYASSVDGMTWIQQTLPLAAGWSAADYNGEVFCGIANGGSSIASQDGADWSSAAMPKAINYTDLTVKSGEFCAIANGSQYTAVSINGLDWLEGELPASRAWVAVTSSAGKYVAIAKNTNICATSADGIAWVEFSLPATAPWVDVAWNGSVFCAISEIGGASFAISSDGESWALVASPAIPKTWSAMAASGSRFYVVSNTLGGGDACHIATSTNGSDWDLYDAPLENWSAIVAQEGTLYGVAPGVLSLFGSLQIGVETIPLADIVDAECEHSNLISIGDIDSSSLSAQVRGYRVQGGSIRSALNPLQSAFQFDARAQGYKIQFVSRGQGIVETIPWESLGASSGGDSDEIIKQSREMDTQLPARTTIKYIDAAREYAVTEQYHERINTDAVNKVTTDIPVVMSANEAARTVEILQNLPWLERTPYSFSLPPIYQHLECCDVISVVTGQAVYDLRLQSANYTSDGRLECEALPERASLYISNAAGAEGVPPSGNIPLAGPSLFISLDIPVIDETLQNSPGFGGAMTGYTNGWPGALAVRSIDSGQTWTDLQAFTGKATVGTARGALPASSATLVDQRSLVVDLISGDLESITRDQMLSGINYAAYGVDGRWEIVRFQNADLQGDGSCLVSHFVRGDHGTEWATGLHVAGDYFVLLDDPDNAFVDMAVGSIGVPANYRGITSGGSLDDAADVPFTYQGVNLECLSPVFASGSRDGSSNFSGTFTRRSRLSSSWWTTGVPAPVGEAFEAYEIEAMDGSSVVRTITVSAAAFSYSAAEQTTDFGSPQASITFRIYQLSAVVGRGYPLEVTL